jgi:uncharacterized protein (DUF934 family)
MTPPVTAQTAIRIFEDVDVLDRPTPARSRDHLRRVPDPEPAISRADPAGPLWRNGRFETDEWTMTAEDEAVGEGPAILPLERFLAEREAFSHRNAPLGVLVAPGEALSELIPHLARVTLVVLPFPKFSDGRSMSTARLLRERHGFGGEIRATGDVLIDQMPLMRRCGVDSFEVQNPVTRKQLAAGKWPDVPFYLQPVGSSQQDEVAAGKRPWARRPAEAPRQAAE